MYIIKNKEILLQYLSLDFSKICIRINRRCCLKPQKHTSLCTMMNMIINFIFK